MDSSLCGLEVSKAWRLLPVSFTQLPKTPADGSKLGPEANLDLALCESKGAWVFLPCARAVGKYPGCLPSWEGPLALPQKQSCLQTGSVLLHVGSVLMALTRPSSFPLTGRQSELFRHFLLHHLPSGQRRVLVSTPFLSGGAILIGGCRHNPGALKNGVLEGTARALSWTHSE